MPSFRLIRRPTAPVCTGTERLPLVSIEDALVRRIAMGERGVAEAVEVALTQAALHRASDVHFEPWPDALGVRFRIDGLLHRVARLPRGAQDQFVTRLKVLARLVAYKRDVPQEGRIDADALAAGKAMRVATFPTVDGEKAVVRLLDAADALPGLTELGFGPGTVEALWGFTERPGGVLLLTGPSSSGKTTTIYALLRALIGQDRPPAHIMTIEDPVEYRLNEASQTETNAHAGFTFLRAVRSALRQDPDVLMVGEIRDRETAQAAIQAGLTGHLVISTVHSGSAAGVFARLLDMEVEPFLLASAVTAVLSQRLVRRNCRECAGLYVPAPDLLDEFGLPREPCRFMRGAGCAACQELGYYGRTAIGEYLEVSAAFSEVLLTRPQTRVLEQAARHNAATSLREDGLARVRAGLTTLEELRRVLPKVGA